MHFRKWKPSRKKINDFVAAMDEIKIFCDDNNISYSSTMDSYYFIINNQSYRVSNHTIESSNNRAFDQHGTQIRNKYHDDKRREDTIYIHASKLRLIEIYTNLKLGFELDGKGHKKR